MEYNITLTTVWGWLFKNHVTNLTSALAIQHLNNLMCCLSLFAAHPQAGMGEGPQGAKWEKARVGIKTVQTTAACAGKANPGINSALPEGGGCSGSPRTEQGLWRTRAHPKIPAGSWARWAGPALGSGAITIHITNPNTAPHSLARKINPALLKFMLICKPWRTQKFLVPFCMKERVRLCALKAVEKYSNVTIYTLVIYNIWDPSEHFSFPLPLLTLSLHNVVEIKIKER